MKAIRPILALAFCLAANGAMGQVARAPDAALVTVNIDRQPMEAALNKFASQTGLQLLFHVEGVITPGLTARRVVGTLPPEKALEQLLRDSGLSFEFINPRTVAIRSAQESATSPSARSSDATSQSMRLAQAADGAAQGRSIASSPEGQSADGGSERRVEEIIVTAQKRSERLQDVPVPVATVSGQTLVDSGLMRLQDYFGNLPGLSVQPVSALAQVIAIRGLTTGAGNPTVGIAVDAVPFGSSTGYGSGLFVPDLDPGELARVEELRGPQGTLFGVSSLGGLLNFVTVDPSTEALGGRMQVGTASVKNGDGLGYNVRGAVNVPVSDTFAIRASAFVRREPGYVDDPVLGIDGVNEQRVSGGRLAALWKPSEAFSLKLSALIQDLEGDGVGDVHVGTGLADLQQSTLKGSGWYERKAHVYGATATARIGGFDLVATSGYNINEYSNSTDLTSSFGPLTQLFFPVPGAMTLGDNKIEKFSQELRLSKSLGARLDARLGAFYTHEDSPYLAKLLVVDPATGATVGQWGTFGTPSTYAERALFADLTVHVTDRFDVQIGGRQSEIRQTYDTQTTTGLYTSVFLGLPSPVIVPAEHAKNTAFTYLFTPSFKLSPDVMVYARLASGYRAGGPNGVPGAPRQYDPDETQTYDLGLKGRFLEGKLSVDTSLYYIDWKDIQFSVLSPAFLAYISNASRAKSQGLEFAVELRPSASLKVAAWAAWNDAQLTEAIPSASSAYALAGERLPLSSRFSGNVSVDQEFALTGTATAFVGASLSYIGERESAFASAFDPLHVRPPTYPSYTRADLRAGARFQAWTLSLFASNLADKRGVLGGGPANFPPYAYTYIQPRTFGVNIARSW